MPTEIETPFSPVDVRPEAAKHVRRTWARSLPGTLALAAAVALLTLPSIGAAPGTDLDASWMAALHLAAQRRMQFGSDIVFTYGPLGFLTVPVPYFAWTWALSVGYVVGLRLALCAAVVTLLRRSIGVPMALAAAFLVGAATRILGPAELALALFAGGCLLLLRRDNATPDRLDWIALTTGGALAGMHLLVKMNSGIFMLLLGAITVWAIGRRVWLSELAFATAGAASLVTAWAATGNRLQDIGLYLRRSAQVASGYSEAMGTEEANRIFEYVLAAIVTVLLAAMAWLCTRELPLRRRMATGLVVATWLFVALKHGFVRHDMHSVIFFGEVCVVAFFLGRKVIRREEAVQLAGLVVLSLLAIVSTGALRTTGSLIDPATTVRQASSLLRPGGLHAAKEAGQQQLRDYYGLDEVTLSTLAGHTVHIHPWDTGVAWAYSELTWRPLPVFQSYSAYTRDLDAGNAAMLASPTGPERILAVSDWMDRRRPQWDSPEAIRAMACHYVEIRTQGPWNVLARVPDRCGPERPLVTLDAAVGQVVEVPQPEDGSIVVARIKGVDASPLYRLRAQLLKIPVVTATVDGTRVYRVVPGTLSGGLVLSAPQDAVGWSPPLAFPGSARTIAIHADGWGLNDQLRIEFTAIPVAQAMAPPDV